jgi:hypothetical protein
MEEIWKDIPSFEGRYQVSSNGRVKSLGRFISNKYNSYYKEGKILSNSTDKDGYKFIIIRQGGIHKNLRINRIVLMAFVRMPVEKELAMHLDDNPANNALSNLMWGTSSMNALDAYAKGRRKSCIPGLGRKGKLHKRARTIIMMDKLGNVINTFECAREASEFVGVGPNGSNIGAACRNYYKNNQTAYGYKWKFAS